MKRAAWYFVRDIMDAITNIESYIQEMTFEDFQKDGRTVNAVVWNIHVIGEASKNIPSSVRSKYLSIHWKDMAAIRDRIVHFYFGIDHEIVWKVITANLPMIKPHIERMLDDLNPQLPLDV